jgi:uncharacterized repeat protein (TIGR01451 family)
MNAWILTALLPLASGGDPFLEPPPAAPLLFVRVIGPAGMQVTVRPATPEARIFPTPTVIGFRPGYRYRLQISNLPEQPGRVVSPSLDVLSTLHVPPGLRAEDFPATLRFSVDDLQQIAAGALVSKVIYLEDPYQAPALNSTPEEPVEFDVLKGFDPLNEARVRGRPMAIVHFGERDVPPYELAMVAVPGTVLAPGDAGLPPPAAPPTLPSVYREVYDPILGPKKPIEEILPDGDDIGPRIGIGPEGKIGGLNPTDTAAEFRYGFAGKRVTISNRVCLFSPRFAVLRQAEIPAGLNLALTPGMQRSAWANAMLNVRVRSEERENFIALRGYHTKYGVRGMQSRVGVAALDIRVGTALVGSVTGVEVRGAVVEAASATQIRNWCKPDQPLVLTKMSDVKAPNVGDVVTFTLTYENYGSKPISEIQIADSLSSRLEFIPGSVVTDRPAVFTVQMNEVYSALLRWDVQGELMPGQSGTIKFQARVR